MGKIVIPKNSASIEEVMGAMQIYYDANDWLSNADFIQIYKNRIGVIGDDRDSSAYTKKTEIGEAKGGENIDRLYPALLDSGAVRSDHCHSYMAVAGTAPKEERER